MIKIVIVDDHKLFRLTLRMAIAECYGFSILGDVDSGEALFALLKKYSCDLVLLDINMPEMNGIEIAGRLRREYPNIKILIISCEDDTNTVRSLMELGIKGFVSKQAGGVDEIINAMNTIMDGFEYYGNDISSIIYQIYVAKKNNIVVTPEFTIREKEIIELCGKGLLAKEIAEQLNISVSTVQNHKFNIFRKLNINNTVEMVQYALKHKIIHL